RVLLALFDSMKDASRAVSGIIARGIVPAALELIDALTIRAVEDAFHVGYPRDAKAVLLIEIDGPEAGLVDLQDVIVDICEEFGSREVRTAHTPEQRAGLWKGRKSAAGSFGRLAPNYYIQDACVPRSKLPEILARTEEIAVKYDLQIANVFHAGDGNLHPCLLFDSSQAGILDRIHDAGAEIMRVCVQAGGTISGEHGIGIEKLEFMPLIFTQADLAMMSKAREAISPKLLFNPCKMIPEGSHCGELAAKSTGITPHAGTWI
ncbi:MAG TPA: FAD-linked oxidase C-terminal domain-containing protein, partial [Anaerolineae bacterium]